MIVGKETAEKAADSGTIVVAAIIKSLIERITTGRIIVGIINPSMDIEAILLERQKTAVRKTTK